MTKVTYIVDFNSNEDYIDRVIKSLKELNGNFRKEYLLVNNQPTDKSVALIKKHAKDLRNSSIILGNKKSNQYGPISLAQGEYIKFINGNEILDKNSTINLLDSLYKHGHRVAFGLQGVYQNENYDKSPRFRIGSEKHVITNPISTILSSKQSDGIICSSASLFARDLLEEIAEPENEIYSQDISLIIKCATKSDFVFCPEIISYKPSEINKTNNEQTHLQDTYNKMRAIRKLLDYDQVTAEKYKKEIYSAIIYAYWKFDKRNYYSFTKYLSSKLYVPNYSLDELKSLLDRMFKKKLFKFQQSS